MSNQENPHTPQKLSYLHNKPPKYLMDGTKLIYHQDRLQEWIDGKRIAPLHIDMGIHKSCNMRCIYCYGIKQVPSPEFIPESRLLLLARDAKDIGVRSLAIIGDGEPTMNKGLYSFVSYGRSIGLDMSVATNGLLLTPSQIKILTDSLVWLRFNISGVDKYDYIHNTRDGFKTFDKVVREAVRQRGHCTIGLQMVCIPECFSEIIPLAEKARDWGVDYLVIKQYSDPECKEMSPFDMQEYDKAVQSLREAESMSDGKTKIIVKWSAIKDTQAITKYKSWDFDRCIDLPFIFQISGNGKCYPCGYLFGDNNFCYGDVSKERLKDIISSQRYWDVVAKVGNTPLKDLCKGQCRHCETNKFIDRLTKEYMNTGDMTQALINMCGGEENYKKIIESPPEHKNFI